MNVVLGGIIHLISGAGRVMIPEVGCGSGSLNLACHVLFGMLSERLMTRMRMVDKYEWV